MGKTVLNCGLHHRDYFGNASGNPEICIIACGLTEVEAFEIESILIKSKKPVLNVYLVNN